MLPAENFVASLPTAKALDQTHDLSTNLLHLG